jgi:hypothetical protein
VLMPIFARFAGSEANHVNAAKLLAQKRQLIERLQEDPGPEEREQIEQLLAKINRALDLLDGAGAGGSD